MVEGVESTPGQDDAFPFEVSTRLAPNGVQHRILHAAPETGFGDGARIARRVSREIVRLSAADELFADADLRQAMWSDRSGNVFVEIRSSALGLRQSLVTGLLEPILEAYAAEWLARGREVPFGERPPLSVDVWVKTPDEGGVVLRVVLYAGPAPMPCLEGPTAPRRSDLVASAEGSRQPLRPQPRFVSGTRPCARADEDLSAAMEFAAGRK